MMDTTFIFNRPTDEKNFIGRQHDVSLLRNMLYSGESFVVYGEPKVGKRSLIYRALALCQKQGMNLLVCEISFMKARSLDDILLGFADAMLRSVVSTRSEFAQLVGELFAGTHLIFDPEQFDSHGTVICTNWELDSSDMDAVFALPAILSERFHRRIVVLLEDFQNISFPEQSYFLLKSLEGAVQNAGKDISFIFTGSHFNAMREIFDVKRLFWLSVVRVIPSRITPIEAADSIYRGFQQMGKVIEKDSIQSTAELLRCNMWYVNHLFCIIDQIGKGYVPNTAIETGLDCLMAIHSPRFYSIICSLTDFQLSLLKAVIDGETRFSASSVIEKYGLNSSANVKRLKDALFKKEIVWFDDDDIPHIQDPLFELWLRKEYFAA